MVYPKFEGLISKGKLVDFFISEGYIEDAVVLLKRVEQAILLKRKRLDKTSSRYSQTMGRYNKALGLIGEALRGENSLLTRQETLRQKRLKNEGDRKWHRRRRR